jgi:hypothetical protein
VSADERVHSGPRAPQRLVRESALPAFERRIVPDHEQQIVVTVGVGIAPSVRAEEIDALRGVGGDQPANHLGESRI